MKLHKDKKAGAHRYANSLFYEWTPCLFFFMEKALPSGRAFNLK